MKRFTISAKKGLDMLSVAAVIAACDQAVKVLISRYPSGQIIWRMGSLLEIVHTANTGAAFSILSGNTLLLLSATTLMLLALMGLILFYREMSRTARWCLAVLLGGGIGNWIDRFAAGSVTDYIRLPFIRFPVFNFADICITLSVGGLILLLLTNRLEPHTGEEHGTGD